eukprot:m.4836 g.4836  ORF g.4836 m.4836 type:complete len:431 (-) comp4400_c0_seq1:32-1324(-)
MPEVLCPFADCLLSTDTRNALVGLVTLTSSLSIVLCAYVIITIQAYQRYRFQPQRFVRTIFVANLLFASAWANPFHHYASWPALDDTWRTEAYCLVNIFFQGTRFGSLFLEIRLVVYTIYCEYFQREGISSRTEILTHIACWVGGVLVGFSFFTACMIITPFPRGVPSRKLHDDTSFAFFACVGVAAVLRLVLYILTLKYQRLWKEHKENFSSPIAVPPPAPLTADGRIASVSDHAHTTSKGSPSSSPPSTPAVSTPTLTLATTTNTTTSSTDSDTVSHHEEKDGHVEGKMVAPSEQKATVATELRIYDSVVKPLRWYPTLFLLFVLPQILITITDDEVPEQKEQMLSRTILSIFIPFRGFCLSLVFIANNRNLVRPAALYDRLKARFNAFNMKRDKIANPPATLKERLITPEEDAYPTEMWARTLRETI